MPLRQFKYRELVADKEAWWEGAMTRIASVRSGCLRECADAFRANLERIGCFAMLPTEFAFQIRRDSLFATNAIYRATGKANLTIDDLVETRLTPQLLAILQEQAQEFESTPIERQKELRLGLGVGYVEALLRGNREMRESMDALFGSIVLAAWTAFECLSADAWAACVDHGPKLLRQKVILSRHVKKPEETSMVEMLAELEYDPTQHFGEFLIQARMVSFQTLPNILKFYGLILEKKEMAVFDEADGYISALAAVRNVLTHKAGRADVAFVKKAAAYSELNGAQVGGIVLLDGELVKRLWNASASIGGALLQAIDNIVTPIPPVTTATV